MRLSHVDLIFIFSVLRFIRISHMHVRSRGLWILPRGDTKYHSSCRYVGHSHFRIYVQDGIGEHNKVETSSKTIFSHNNTRDGSKFTVQEASSSFKAKVLRFLLLDCHDSAHYVYDICSLDSDDRDQRNLLAVFFNSFTTTYNISVELCVLLALNLIADIMV